MGSKWPLMLITFFLLIALGLTITSIERTKVMKNWAKRRCDFPILAASTFFKPEWDTRTSDEFAKDNFDFCMKTYVTNFTEASMAPLNKVFEQQVGVAGSSAGMVNSLRLSAKSLFDAFMSLMEQYMENYKSSIFQVSRIVQHLRMAVQRINGMVMSFLYMGLSLFRGMINSFQFIIKVVIIICLIIVGFIIILFFVLFPFLPFILGVLALIITSIVLIKKSVNDSLGGSAMTDAENAQTDLCFSECTIFECEEGIKNVKDIQVGDKLKGCGHVKAVMELSGKGVKLFNINGIYVSGSHLVKNPNGSWNAVKDDPRSVPSEKESDIIYCFNTSSHDIPVYSDSGTIIFRDWEEIAEDDAKGQYMWCYFMLKKLNNSSNYVKWKDGITISDISIMDTKVKTINGFIDISELKIRDKVLDRNNKEQSVLGIVKGNVKGIINCEKGHDWHTQLYEYIDGIWIKGESTFIPGEDSMEGRTLITESGEFIIWDGKEKIIRDFTEIGLHNIHEMYSFVDSRLNRL